MTPQPFPYAVNFRGFWACPCLAAWIPVYEAMLRHVGALGPQESLTIWQLIGLAAASGNTHSRGGAEDDASISPLAILIARQMGCAKWHRPYNWDGAGGMEHGHGVLNGCPHNGPAWYQIPALEAGYNGLGYEGHAASDNGPRSPGVFPLRTFQQGIQWAKAQMEAAMPGAITFSDSALGFRAQAEAGICTASQAWTVADCDAFIAQQKAAGNTGIFVYISRHPSKCMPKWAILRCLAAGLAITFVFEDGPDNPKGGTAQGHADAAFALAYLKALGAPKGITVWCAFDSSGYTMVLGSPERAYAQAFAGDVVAGGFEAGGYGNRAVVDSGIFTKKWLVETWTHIGTAGVHVVQCVYNSLAVTRGIPGCDVNLIVHGFHCWTATVAPQAVKPNPAADQWVALIKHYAVNLNSTYPPGSPRGDAARSTINTWKAVA